MIIEITWQSRRCTWLSWTVRYPRCLSTVEASESPSALATYAYAEPVRCEERWL